MDRVHLCSAEGTLWNAYNNHLHCGSEALHSPGSTAVCWGLFEGPWGGQKGSWVVMWHPFRQYPCHHSHWCLPLARWVTCWVSKWVIPNIWGGVGWSHTLAGTYLVSIWLSGLSAVVLNKGSQVSKMSHELTLNHTPGGKRQNSYPYCFSAWLTSKLYCLS